MESSETTRIKKHTKPKNQKSSIKLDIKKKSKNETKKEIKKKKKH